MKSDLRLLLIAESNKLNSLLLNTTNEFTQIGIYRGISSQILFFSVLYLKTREEKYYYKLAELLSQSIDLVDVMKGDVSFSSGLSGWAWTINYLNSKKIINGNDLLNHFDEIIFQEYLNMISSGNFDPINGAVGICNYYFQEVKNHNKIEILIDNLYDLFKSDSKYKVFSRKHKTEDKFIIDLGLAHGIVGYIYFLNKCIANNIKTKVCENLSKVCFEILHFSNQSFVLSGSHYPYFVNVDGNKFVKDEQKSRLAWCYGDLSILFTLLSTSNQNSAVNILNQLNDSIGRLEVNDTLSYDNGFCHGSSGIAYLYWKIFSKSKKKQFEVVSNHWITEIINETKNYTSLEEYKFLVDDFDNRKFKECNYLLEGSVGLALVFFTILNPKFSTWDRCLLLS